MSSVANTATNILLTASGLHKQYQMGSETLRVLCGVRLEVSGGEWVCVLGASGSGKSTLLHLLGGLDTPDQGTVIFRDQDMFGMAPGMRDRFRNEHVGFVFQSYHLLPELNVLENVLISAMVRRSILQWPSKRAETHQAARSLLERVGLGERLGHRPNELSGGERQRVAIARALVNEPDVLLADEPTGNLDRNTGGRIMDLLEGLHNQGQTIVMVTHDSVIADRSDRTVCLENGTFKANR
jgi:ABC-type lipoprotein export system ATPase subunit